MLIGAATTRRFLQNTFFASVKVGAGAVLLLAFSQFMQPDKFSDSLLFFAAALIIWGIVDFDILNNLPRIPSLRWLGDISYSIYIIQMVTLSAVAHAWSYVGMPKGTGMSILQAIVTVGVTIVTAALCHRWIEVPSQRYAKAIAHKVHNFEKGEKVAQPQEQSQQL